MHRILCVYSTHRRSERTRAHNTHAQIHKRVRVTLSKLRTFFVVVFAKRMQNKQRKFDFSSSARTRIVRESVTPFSLWKPLALPSHLSHTTVRIVMIFYYPFRSSRSTAHSGLRGNGASFDIMRTPSPIGRRRRRR